MTKNLFFLLFKKPKKALAPADRERAQKLAEIGAQLRQFREQHSICLEKVAVVTMIRTHLLQAIEEGQLDQLPEPVYTQGLIKRYAEVMGLDGDRLADSFPVDSTQPAEVKPSWRDWPATQLRPLHLYLLYIILIIGSVNGLSQAMNRSEPSGTGLATTDGNSQPSPAATNPTPTIAESPQPPSNAVTQVPSPVPSPVMKVESPSSAERDDYAFDIKPIISDSPVAIASPTVPIASVPTSSPSSEANLSPTNSATPAASPDPNGTQPSPATSTTLTQASNEVAGPVSISVTFKDESWVQIEVDGKTEFEGTLPTGTQRTWQAKEQLVFKAGNAGGVMLAVNNGQAKQLGEPGAVEEVVVKANNPQAGDKKNEG